MDVRSYTSTPPCAFKAWRLRTALPLHLFGSLLLYKMYLSNIILLQIMSRNMNLPTVPLVRIGFHSRTLCHGSESLWNIDTHLQDLHSVLAQTTRIWTITTVRNSKRIIRSGIQTCKYVILEVIFISAYLTPVANSSGHLIICYTSFHTINFQRFLLYSFPFLFVIELRIEADV
jgi:hypothetical protein